MSYHGTRSAFQGSNSAGAPGPAVAPIPGQTNFSVPLATAFAAAAAQTASLWDQSKVSTLREALLARAAAGPITARDANAFASLLPTYVLTNTNPIPEFPAGTSVIGAYGSLLPQPQQGLESWIWIYTRLLDDEQLAACASAAGAPPAAVPPQYASGGGAPAPAPAPFPVPVPPVPQPAGNSGSGTLVFLWQTTIDPGMPRAGVTPSSKRPVTGTASATPVSVWCLFCGAVNPATKQWVPSPVVYLDDSQVTFSQPQPGVANPTYASFVSLNSPDVQGLITQSLTGSSYSLVFKNAGFALAAVVASERGPTFEQSTGNLTRTGALQNAYWSMVDGRVVSATMQLPAPNYALTGVTIPYSYNGGFSWYDYEQIGIDGAALPKSPVVTMLGAVMRTPAATPWLFFTVQSLDMQGNGTVTGKQWERLNAGEAGVGTGNLWLAGKGQQLAAPIHDVPITVTVASVYPGTTVPSAITVRYAATANSPPLLLKLVSISAQPPLLTNATGSAGYESPADVVNRACTFGVIEYFPNRSDPTVALTLGNLPASLKKMSAPSPLAVGTLSAAGVLLALLVVALVLIGVYTPTCTSKTSAKAKATSSSAVTSSSSLGGRWFGGGSAPVYRRW